MCSVLFPLILLELNNILILINIHNKVLITILSQSSVVFRDFYFGYHWLPPAFLHLKGAAISDNRLFWKVIWALSDLHLALQLPLCLASSTVTWSFIPEIDPAVKFYCSRDSMTSTLPSIMLLMPFIRPRHGKRKKKFSSCSIVYLPQSFCESAQVKHAITGVIYLGPLDHNMSLYPCVSILFFRLSVPSNLPCHLHHFLFQNLVLIGLPWKRQIPLPVEDTQCQFFMVSLCISRPTPIHVCSSYLKCSWSLVAFFQKKIIIVVELIVQAKNGPTSLVRHG